MGADLTERLLQCLWDWIQNPPGPRTSPHPAVSWSHQVILTGSHACLCVLCRGDVVLVLNWRKIWSGVFWDQLLTFLVVEFPMVKWYLCAFYQPEFAEMFSMEISLWPLQQQLIHNTVFLGQEGERWMPYRPPAVENYPPWDNFSLKRGQEKLDWVISPRNCGCEQGQENSASVWILDVPLHVLSGSAAVLAASS